MKPKKTKQQERNRKKKRAISLYKQDFTTREISKLIGRSHTWVAQVVKENGAVDKNT